uniref:Vacuolar protein sortingassociated protein putative n=1 Tax=Albugo laibachii Nc14 TaxID=890382 RepID=F0W606_9STRA|nr:vacuolar protein sortingassociated protein putative [Albugo laibachii Nc14]|eukprot:CCA16548.1 vacuolar protein sortingassociated protein putative [Albugo laibachii Nc14]
MAKAIIASILESQLGKYIEGLSGDSLHVGFWSGEIALQNVQLKHEAILAEFEDLQLLPLRIIHGSIKKINIYVPWNQLTTSSVRITIQGVTLLLAPNTVGCDEVTHDRSDVLWKRKQSQLERYELIRRHAQLAKANNQAEEDESTFLSRLTHRIIEHIQVTLSDVHFRYEDDLSCQLVHGPRSRAFACGITLEKLALSACDAKDKMYASSSVNIASKQNVDQEYSFKKLRVENFGVYIDEMQQTSEEIAIMASEKGGNTQKLELETVLLDAEHMKSHQFVVSPSQMEVYLIKKETSFDTNSDCKYNLQSCIPSINVSLSRTQYQNVIMLHRASMMIHDDLIHRQQQSRNQGRPIHSASTRPRDWWDYIVSRALPSRSRKMTWSSILQSCRERKLYIATYTEHVRAAENALATTTNNRELEYELNLWKAEHPQEAATLENFEKVYPIEFILKARNHAEECERIRNLEQKLMQSSTTQQESGKSWYKYFFGSSLKQDDSLASSLMSEQAARALQEAYAQAIEKEQQEALPALYDILRVKLQVEQWTLTLLAPPEINSSDAVESPIRPLATLVVVQSRGCLAMKLCSTLEWSLKLDLDQFEAENKLVASGMIDSDNCNSLRYLCTPTSKDSGNHCDSCFSLKIEYFHGSSDCKNGDSRFRSPVLRLRLSTEPLKIVVDPRLMVYLFEFFHFSDSEESANNDTIEDQESSWRRRTTTMTDWISSYDDTSEAITQDQTSRASDSTQTLQSDLLWDILVNVNAPVIVFTEEDSGRQDNAMVIIDLGHTKLVHDDTLQIDRSTSDWTLYLREMRVFFGPRDQADGRKQLLHDIDLEFALAQSVSGALFTIKAGIPNVAITISEEQIEKLNRLYQGFLSKALETRAHADEMFFLDAYVSKTASYSAPSDLQTSTQNVSLAYCEFFLDEVIINIVDSYSYKELFAFSVSKTTFSADIWTHHNTIHIKIQSLKLIDGLYEITCPYHHLIDTKKRQEDSSHLENLLLVDIKNYFSTYFETENHDTVEANCLVDVSFNTLQVQWNPSSIGLLYRLLHLVPMFDQEDILDSQHMAIDRKLSSKCSEGKDSTRPSMIIHTSLVEFSVAFNKDEMDRPLVCLIAKEAIVVGKFWSTGNSDISGNLGDFVMKDLTVSHGKHNLYVPLIGLHHRHSEAVSDEAVSLLQFSYKSDEEGNSLDLFLRPIRMIYYHQQLLELADYFIEGVLKPFGLGSEDVWVAASQLLLHREQSSLRLSAIMIEPSIVLPMQWNVAQHIATTAEKLTLQHDQNASIVFDRSLKDETREAHQRYRLVSEEILPASPGHTVMRTDFKQVILSNVNVFCVVDGGETYQPLFSRPIQSTVDVIDTMDQPQPGRELAKEIPRFTVSAHVYECNQETSKDPITIDLNREQYLTLVAVFEKNLGADEAIAGDIHWSKDDSRPQVEYSYARSDVQAVTITLAVWMTNLRCRFVDASQVLETDAISISLDVLTDQDPTLTLTIKGLKLGKSKDQLLLISTTPTRLLLTWNSELPTSTVAVDIANVKGWLEPDLLLELIDFLELPSVNSLKDELQACSNATAILQSSEHDAQTWDITLIAKEISWMLPKTEIARESVQLACSADIDVHLLFEPYEEAKLEDSDGSTKIGRAVLIKAKSLQFYSMSQSRTDGTFGHGRNLQILEPCDVQIDINDVAPHEAQKQLIVSIQVSPVHVYLSYKDFRNILWTYESIAKTVHTHFVSKNERENGHNATPNVLSTALITAKGSISGNSELIQWHQHFTLECTHVVVTVINDCEHCDMGLAQLCITNGSFFANINEQLEDSMVSGAPQRFLTISGGGSLTTHLMYLNPQIGRWHPMCSPWQLEATFQGVLYQERCRKDARDGRRNEMHVLLNANSPLKVIVTQDLMDLVVSAMSAFERQRDNDKCLCDIPHEIESQSPHPSRSTQLDAPILLRNITGLELNVAISSQASKLLHGDIMCVWPTHQRGKGSGVVRRHDGLDSLRLDLLDFGQEAQFEPVLGISLQRLGSQAFPMVPNSGVDANSASQNGSFVVNVTTQLVDGRLFVSLSSLVKVVNQTTLSIQVLVHSSSWKDPVILGTIASKDSLAIPVMLAWASELRVRPVFPAPHTFGWSAPVPIQTRSRLELELESSCAWASAYFCVRMAFKQSLRIVTFRYPISVVNKLPVPLRYKTRNAMATDKRIVDSSVLKDRENEVIPVGGSSGVWWCTVHQRPLLKLLINGYSSTKWMEWLQNRVRGEESMLEIVVPRTDGGSLKVLLQISEIGRSIQISILSPIWMINRTGLDLVYGSEMERDSYFPGIDARSRSGNAQFCAFGLNMSGKAAPKFRIGIPSAECRDNGVMWSALFEADPKYLNWQDECLSIRLLPDRSGSTMLYEFGISSDVATSHFGSVTTLVSILPRFLVQNLSRHTILLTESNAVGDAHAHLATGADHIIARNEVYALYWMQGRRSSVRFSAVSEHPEGLFSWSEAYRIDRVTSWKLLLRHNQQDTVVSLRVAINTGSLTQASYLITIYDEDAEGMAGTESKPNLNGERLGWEKWIIDAHMVGGSVTVEGSSKLKIDTDTVERGEKILCCSIRNVQLKLDENTETKCAHLNVESLIVRDLTQNLVVLEPLESISSPGDPIVSFVEVLLIEKPTDTKGVHGLASKYYEVVHVKTQSVRISATMQFVNRLNRSFQNILAHVSSTKTTISSFSTTDTSLAFDMEDTQGLECDTCEDLLTLFGPSTITPENQSMASVTGPKVYVQYLRIDPISVVFSFSRNDSPDTNSGQFSSNFWLKHFKIKLENAHLTLAQFEIKEALATQEALLEKMTEFYVKSVKSQALEMLESIKVTSLVSSVVTTGLSSIVSSIIGKSDPQLASHIQESDAIIDGNEAQNQCVRLDSVSSTPLTFTYTPLSNSRLLQKHSHLIDLCTSETQFLQEIQHLIYDWDSNHTGILARGCVALGIYNNSHDALMLAARLQDGAELRILPFGRTHLASSINSRGNWNSKRSAIVFAWGYTPTLLTTSDVYFTLSSNACNVYATRRSARLKALKGYTATFTHQQRQKWWTYNIVLVSDELSDVKISNSNELSESTSIYEYECAFSEPSIGLVVSQSSPKSVRVYKCCERLLNGDIGPAFASKRIRVGDEIDSVNGQKIFSTSQFKDIVVKSARPVTIRFCRRRQCQTEAFNLFGDAK